MTIQKDKASEQYDDEETPQFKVEKVEAGGEKEEYSEGEKDAGRYSETPPEGQEVEMRRSELKEIDDNDEEYFECKSNASLPTPPEIIVSSPKEKESLNAEYLLSHIYKAETRGEGEGEEEAIIDQDKQVEGLESSSQETKSDKKESNMKNDENSQEIQETENATQEAQDEENETDEQEKLKENEELLDISAKLLLLDMAGQRNDGFSSPESCPGSPMSEEDRPESPTYVNLYQGDDINLLNTGVSPRCSPGNLTPLDPISEQDESEEDKDKDGDTPRKTSLPTLFKSNLSSGVDNLSALSGEDDDAKEQPSSDDEALKDTKDAKDEPDAVPEAKPEATPEPAPEATPEVPHEEATKGSVKRRRRRKKGRVTREKESPVFLNEGVRTFSNPISYFGGPNIKYEEEDAGAGAAGGDEGGESRLSVISNVSLD